MKLRKVVTVIMGISIAVCSIPILGLTMEEPCKLYTMTNGEKVANTPPVINGVFDVTIKVGEGFDVMAGVTAYDEEDGDLTGEIVFSGFVNNNVIGSYTIGYSVTDSEGATTTASRVVVVV